jgi:type II secretory pathway predicted ATPase ExeA/outer membrane protein OmpA-like peptidoglycan-associated protein
VFKEFYGLTLDPFRLSPDVRFCCRHQHFARAKAYMHYALHQGEGFVMVTGRPGTGKTTLIEDLLAELSASSVRVARITSTQVAADDLLQLVANAFGTDSRGMTKASVLLTLQSVLKQQRRTGRNALLLVDEAQNLPFESMEELRMITNLQEGASPLLQVILVGQDALRSIIAEPRMEQLRQRILAACRMEPLSLDETRDYLHHRLLCAGWRGVPTLSGEAVWLLHSASGGIPRTINAIAGRLLLYGCTEETTDLGGDDVRLVVGDLQDEYLFAFAGSNDQLQTDEAGPQQPPDFRDLDITDPPPAEITEASTAAVQTASMASDEPTVDELALADVPAVSVATTIASAQSEELRSPTQTGTTEKGEPAAPAGPPNTIEPASADHVSTETPASPTLVTKPAPASRQDVASVQESGPVLPETARDRLEAQLMRTADPATTRGRRIRAWVAAAASLAALSILGILVVDPRPAMEQLESLAETLRSATVDLWSFAAAPNTPEAGKEPNVAPGLSRARDLGTAPSAVPFHPDHLGDVSNGAQSISDASAPKADAEPRQESASLAYAAQTNAQQTNMASPSRSDIATAIPEAERVIAPTPADEEEGTEASPEAQNQESTDETEPWPEISARIPDDRKSERTGDDPTRQTEIPPQEDTTALSAVPQSRPADSATSLSTLVARLRSLGYEPEETSAGTIKLTLFKQISFETDRAEIDRSSRRSIQSLAEALSNHPDVEITVIGHTDDLGPAAYNANLSLRRADAVATLLRAGGVLDRNISSEGRGEREPLTLVPVGGVPAHIANRRIELVIRQIRAP